MSVVSAWVARPPAELERLSFQVVMVAMGEQTFLRQFLQTHLPHRFTTTLVVLAVLQRGQVLLVLMALVALLDQFAVGLVTILPLQAEEMVALVIIILMQL